MISREDADGAAVLRLAHGKVSALDVELCHALVEALEDLASDASRALIVTGTGSAFSAGVNLFRVLDGGAAYLQEFLPAMERLFSTLLTFPKPVIAAINGHAIAGGCILAAACDYRVMAAGTSRMGIPELLVGVPFPTLPFEIMRARVSAQHFRQLVLSGRTVQPSEALSVGFIDEIAPADRLLPAAHQAAVLLLQIPQITFALTKRAFSDAVLARVNAATSLNDDVVRAWAHPDVLTKIRSYVEQTVGRK